MKRTEADRFNELKILVYDYRVTHEPHWQRIKGMFLKPTRKVVGGHEYKVSFEDATGRPLGVVLVEPQSTPFELKDWFDLSSFVAEQEPKPRES